MEQKVSAYWNVSVLAMLFIAIIYGGLSYYVLMNLGRFAIGVVLMVIVIGMMAGGLVFFAVKLKAGRGDKNFEKHMDVAAILTLILLLTANGLLLMAGLQSDDFLAAAAGLVLAQVITAILAMALTRLAKGEHVFVVKLGAEREET